MWLSHSGTSFSLFSGFLRGSRKGGGVHRIITDAFDQFSMNIVSHVREAGGNAGAGGQTVVDANLDRLHADNLDLVNLVKKMGENHVSLSGDVNRLLQCTARIEEGLGACLGSRPGKTVVEGDAELGIEVDGSLEGPSDL